jgi:hypothetical protein
MDAEVEEAAVEKAGVEVDAAENFAERTAQHIAGTEVASPIVSKGPSPSPTREARTKEPTGQRPDNTANTDNIDNTVIATAARHEGCGFGHKDTERAAMIPVQAYYATNKPAAALLQPQPKHMESTSEAEHTTEKPKAAAVAVAKTNEGRTSWS